MQTRAHEAPMSREACRLLNLPGQPLIIPENTLAAMQYDEVMHRATALPVDDNTKRRFYQARRRALRRLHPEWAAYYTQFNLLLGVHGGDYAAVEAQLPRPAVPELLRTAALRDAIVHGSLLAEDVYLRPDPVAGWVPGEDHDQRQARLLAGPLPDPYAYRPGDTTARAKDIRRQLREDRVEAKRLRSEAARGAKAGLRQAKVDLEAAERELARSGRGDPLWREKWNAVISLRGQVRAARTYSQRRRDDMDFCWEHKRPAPVTRRPTYSVSIPPWLRVHSPLLD